jgi:hypothetical protein
MSDLSCNSVFFAILIVMIRLAPLTISWYAEAARERARARSCAALLAMARPGTTVIERNADGSVVVLVISGGDGAPRSSPVGGNRKERG